MKASANRPVWLADDPPRTPPRSIIPRLMKLNRLYNDFRYSIRSSFCCSLKPVPKNVL